MSPTSYQAAPLRDMKLYARLWKRLVELWVIRGGYKYRFLWKNILVKFVSHFQWKKPSALNKEAQCFFQNTALFWWKIFKDCTQPLRTVRERLHISSTNCCCIEIHGLAAIPYSIAHGLHQQYKQHKTDEVLKAVIKERPIFPLNIFTSRWTYEWHKNNFRHKR